MNESFTRLISARTTIGLAAMPITASVASTGITTVMTPTYNDGSDQANRLNCKE